MVEKKARELCDCDALSPRHAGTFGLAGKFWLDELAKESGEA